MINKVLIANRGEIACRIIKTLRKLNICSIAVYSYADKHSKHVYLADETYCLGNSPASDSYLNIKKILDAATKLKADAIHPGYGFLSENAIFADAVTQAGIKFIGPSAKVIEIMGNKSLAKKFMLESKVPLLPGMDIKDDNSNLNEIVSLIGFPMLIKASAGGGGKGMRVVKDAQSLNASIEACRRESLASFGDPSIMAEKFLTNARHIEVQVAADQHGNVIHLFERDCSMQRRHQKVIEEAPAIGISDSLKQEMFNCVVSATKALQYEGVGTFEFLVEDNKFYFLEVNTRLQVEHPVTELITGVDLVKMQIDIANGASIDLEQNNIEKSGHAIECRIYAEDPSNSFLPATGQIEHINAPNEKGIRIDNGVLPGNNVSMFYDPMLAKIIAYGNDRNQCITTLKDFMAKYAVYGVINNVSFLRHIISSSEFCLQKYNTKTLDDGKIICPQPEQDLILKSLVFATLLSIQSVNLPIRVNQRPSLSLFLSNKGKTYNINATNNGDCHWQMRILDEAFIVSSHLITEDSISATINDVKYFAIGSLTETSVYISLDNYDFCFSKKNYDSNGTVSTDENIIVSPMPGIIRKINIKTGDKVSENYVLLVVEAMKMEHSIAVNNNKVVDSVSCKIGDFVSTGQTLVTLK